MKKHAKAKVVPLRQTVTEIRLLLNLLDHEIQVLQIKLRRVDRKINRMEAYPE